MTDLLGSSSLHQADEPDFQDLTAQEPAPSQRTLGTGLIAPSEQPTVASQDMQPDHAVMQRDLKEQQQQQQQLESGHQQGRAVLEQAASHQPSVPRSSSQHHHAAMASTADEGSPQDSQSAPSLQEDLHADTAPLHVNSGSSATGLRGQQAHDPHMPGDVDRAAGKAGQQQDKSLRERLSFMPGATSGKLQQQQQTAAGRIADRMVSEEAHAVTGDTRPVNQGTGLPNTAPLSSLLSR